jgi:signal peptidase I
VRPGVLLAVLGLVVLCAAIVVYAVAAPSVGRLRVPSDGMAPTLKAGNKITVNRDAYGAGSPERGDIVVFHPPGSVETGEECAGGRPPTGQACDTSNDDAADVLFVKRVVGLPGDHLSVRRGLVVLRGRPQEEPYTARCGGGEGCDLPREITIGDGEFFVLGDNRGSSDDSRFWGPVKEAWIVGRVDECSALHLHCSPRR